jgi:hypothetical protein
MPPGGGEALGERFEAALDRIGAYFMGSSPVQEAAAQIARLLSEMKIDYAIAGALCLRHDGSAPAPGEALDPYVRAKYDELWQAAQQPEEDY